MAAMTTDRSLATVRRFMTTIVEGDLDEARSLLSDDVVVSAAGGVPYSGEYHGPQGLFELLTNINDVLELASPPAIEYHFVANTVVARYRATFTARACGRSIDMGVVEVFTVRDGLITEVDVYHKDPAAVTELLAQ